ncbi:kelch repeat-containing protein [Corallococcus carmarthensis]|uniref:kelch repeat-containing protein n=1 Tax=Corallococcus carmarthensis TaxID=2316728 RepID=UPI00148C6D16|nr:kelch repeat-containing protein [Corallococcus carmarthensis]NOK16222.1 tandem-95 repeat protein [Corallococcus carmarthensis]
MRRPVVVWLCLLLGLTACDRVSSRPREEVGVTLESRLRETPGGSEARLAAVRAWREAPSDERARALAHAYFPEWAPGEESLADASPAALRVTVPETATGTLEVATRGLTFRARRHGVEGQGLQTKDRATGPHFWAPVGARSRDAAGRWVTSRVEEYDVAPEGAAEHRVRYTVEVPEGIVAVRDLGDSLEFADAQGVPRLRMHTLVARDAEGLSREGTVQLHGGVRVPGAGPTRYALSGRSLDVAMAVDLRGMQGPVVVDPGWSSTGVMSTVRRYHTATLLPSGKVLVAGGRTPGAVMTPSAELFDPVTGTWKGVMRLATGRAVHTATLLPSGRVLVVGGVSGVTPLATTELFDPESETWSPADVMTTGRAFHTATLLAGGRVLVAGGQGSATPVLTSAELFDPETGAWTPAGAMSFARAAGTATLLPSGHVLLAGGNTATAVTELFNPATGTWTTTGPMVNAREAHTATLLPNGKVLIAGGTTTGGYNQMIAVSETYDPVTGRWTATGAMPAAHKWHTASLMPDGRVLVVGGVASQESGWALGTNSTEAYNPMTGTWQRSGLLQVARGDHTATLLPSGRLLIAGGYNFTTNSSDANHLNSPELLEAPGVWSSGLPASTPRVDHTVTPLPSGQLLAVGGRDATGALASADLYDRDGARWSGASWMLIPRTQHTATLLPSGRVLVTGGSDGFAPLADAEMYDAASSQWLPAGRMSVERTRHTATLLPSGKVLVTGGAGYYGVHASVELYDPRSGLWTSASPMATPRAAHSATLLPNGKVLVAGGTNGSGPLNTAQVYDPVTDTWSAVLTMLTAREDHTATALSSGKVLLVGGLATGGGATSEVEQYDPGLNTWTRLTRLGVPRAGHTATLLPSGDVVIMGGHSGAESYFNSVERFEPSTATWDYLTPMVTARTGHTATLLPTGEVIVSGGRSSTVQASVEAFDPMSSVAAVRPTLDTPRILSPGATFIATGTRLRGVSDGGSGTTNSSASEAPLVRLVSVESGAVSWVKGVTGWQDGKQFSARVPTVAAGQYLLLVTVQGATGGRMVRVTDENAAPVVLNASASVQKNTPIAITLSGMDADSDSLTYSVVQAPQHGTLSGAGASRVYTPATGYSGVDTFTFRVNDGVADSNVGTVTLRVSNSIPVALAFAVTTSKAKPVQLMLSGQDGDGDALTFRLLTQPTRGTLSGTAPYLTYTPNAGHTGTDSFTYRANDGTTDSWPVSVTLSTVNLAPVARSASLTTLVGQGVPLTLEATDADGDMLTYSVLQAPAHGTLSGTAPHLVYTPQAGYEGPDAFTFRAHDGTTASTSATVTTTVVAQVPHAPSVPVLRSPSDTALVTSGDVTFTWDAAIDPEGDAVSYRLELSRDGTVLASLNAAGTSLTLPGTLSSGTYTWRVEAQDFQGHRSGFSAPSSFSVALNPLWRITGGQGLREEDAPSGFACSAGGPSGWAPWLGTLVLLAWGFRRRPVR